jgi:D-alanine-D-alanine ligase
MRAMFQNLHITLMLGGPSAEREVSLRTGAAVAQALSSLGHRVHELDPQESTWRLPDDTQVVFLALHGTYGEDGTVQRRLDELGVPYTGCDAETSRVAFDKFLTKQKCVAAGVPTARHVLFDEPTANWPMGWQPPVVLKPVRQGSSVGLQFVERVSEWSGALAEAFRYDTQVLMEEKISGRETTVGILADEVLPVVEVRPKSGGFDYHNKYTAGATEVLCRAGRVSSGGRRRLCPGGHHGPPQWRTGGVGSEHPARNDRAELVTQGGGRGGPGLRGIVPADD